MFWAREVRLLQMKHEKRVFFCSSALKSHLDPPLQKLSFQTRPASFTKPSWPLRSAFVTTKANKKTLQSLFDPPLQKLSFQTRPAHSQIIRDQFCDFLFWKTLPLVSFDFIVFLWDILWDNVRRWDEISRRWDGTSRHWGVANSTIFSTFDLNCLSCEAETSEFCFKVIVDKSVIG